MAFDAATPAVPQRSLSEFEKAALFDLVIESAERGEACGPYSLEQANVLAAFVRAYVRIRDREEGVI